MVFGILLFCYGKHHLRHDFSSHLSLPVTSRVAYWKQGL